MVVLLHGIGGDSNSVRFIGALAPRFNNVIRVAPNGYLKGQVIHYKLIGGGHGLGVDRSKTFIREAVKIIADFLLE